MATSVCTHRSAAAQARVEPDARGSTTMSATVAPTPPAVQVAGGIRAGEPLQHGDGRELEVRSAVSVTASQEASSSGASDGPADRDAEHDIIGAFIGSNDAFGDDPLGGLNIPRATWREAVGATVTGPAVRVVRAASMLGRYTRGLFYPKLTDAMDENGAEDAMADIDLDMDMADDTDVPPNYGEYPRQRRRLMIKLIAEGKRQFPFPKKTEAMKLTVADHLRKKAELWKVRGGIAAIVVPAATLWVFVPTAYDVIMARQMATTAVYDRVEALQGLQPTRTWWQWLTRDRPKGLVFAQ